MVLSVLVVGSQVILPAYFLVSLWKRLKVDRMAWLLKVLYTGTFLLFLFVVGRWDSAGYYLRYVFPGLFIAAAVASFPQRLVAVRHAAYGRLQFDRHRGSPSSNPDADDRLDVRGRQSRRHRRWH